MSIMPLPENMEYLIMFLGFNDSYHSLHAYFQMVSPLLKIAPAGKMCMWNSPKEPGPWAICHVPALGTEVMLSVLVCRFFEWAHVFFLFFSFSNRNQRAWVLTLCWARTPLLWTCRVEVGHAKRRAAAAQHAEMPHLCWSWASNCVRSSLCVSSLAEPAGGLQACRLWGLLSPDLDCLSLPGSTRALNAAERKVTVH